MHFLSKTSIKTSKTKNKNPPFLWGESLLVPKMGFEPTHLAALVPETSASTNSATSAHTYIDVHEESYAAVMPHVKLHQKAYTKTHGRIRSSISHT